MSMSILGPETPLGHAEAKLHVQPTCLIVEDQALIGLALEAYLEEVGFGDCETVPSAAEAMEWLSTHTADVVILDYSLKDGPCTRLARALREHGIPFVVYSGHQRTIAPLELQGVSWLNKPCDRSALLAALISAVPQLAAGRKKIAA
jgi:DNA-binding response OmpR family regulator